MPPQRTRYARRQSVWTFLIILSVVVVVGFAAAGYEINHQRTQINDLRGQVEGLSRSIEYLQNAVKLLASR